MNQQTHDAVQINYGRGGQAVAPRIRLGVISLSVSILATVISALVGLATNRTSISPLVVNTVLEATLLWSIVGLGMGIVGLFFRHGRTAAIVGIAFSVFDAMLIPMLMVA